MRDRYCGERRSHSQIYPILTKKAIAALEEERRQKQQMRDRLLELGVDPNTL